MLCFFLRAPTIDLRPGTGLCALVSVSVHLKSVCQAGGQSVLVMYFCALLHMGLLGPRWLLVSARLARCSAKFLGVQRAWISSMSSSPLSRQSSVWVFGICSWLCGVGAGSWILLPLSSTSILYGCVPVSGFRRIPEVRCRRLHAGLQSLPNSHQSFPVPGRRYRDLHHRSRRFAALRSIQQQQNSSKQSSVNAPPSLWKQMADHVSGRPVLQETGAVSDRESVATTIFSSQSKGKRDRDTNVAHSLKDRKNLQKILERKVDSAVRGEMMAHRKLYEAEAEAEARNWEKKYRLCFSGDQSRIWISAISTTPSKSMGRSVSERQDMFVWRIGIEK